MPEPRFPTVAPNPEKPKRVDIKFDMKSEAVASGIGQRMLDKKDREKHIPTNRPLKEGARPEDCEFVLEIRSDERFGDPDTKHVAVVIKFPSSATEELTYNAWAVGDISKDGTLKFNNSFGAFGDAPLDEKQKEVLRRLVANALAK